MTTEEDKQDPKEPQKSVIREEVNLQFHWYLLAFFTIYTLSFVLPGIIFTLYLHFFFTPYFLGVENFVFIFTELNSLIVLLLMPFVIIICYLIHLFFIALITRLFWQYTEKINPTKDGIIPRNIQSKTLNYYNIRSFMIKYPKNAFVKGLFPWLINWLYNFVGTNKVGKGTTIEEQFGADRYVDIGDNCYIGVNSGFSSHSVAGIFGNISYFEIKLGDNVTASALNCLAPGVEIADNSYLLPIAGATKHNKLKGNNYYFGAPLRKIFTNRLVSYLKIPQEILDLEKEYRNNHEKIEGLKKALAEENMRILNFKNNKDQNIEEVSENEDIDDMATEYKLDFVTSSAISKSNIKFLVVYLPILWFSGLLLGITWYGFVFYAEDLIIIILLMPLMIFASYFIFIFACTLFGKLLLILINLIHKPKEGIFKTERGDADFEFWCLRIELKKLIIWLMNNCPLPWIDTWAFRWFGIKIDFTSHLYDAWVDMEFIKFGRKVTVGQGAVVMSSMIVGKYLIIKKVFFDDYAVIGGVSNISPGTIIGKDTVIGAFSITNYEQVLEPGWIYFGIPGIKLKPNKYAESRRDIITKKDVDTLTRYEVKHEVSIDKDKKHLLNNNRT